MRGVLHLENYSASLDLTGCLKIICKKWEENEELFDSFTERPCTAYWSTPSVSVTGLEGLVLTSVNNSLNIFVPSPLNGMELPFCWE